jgi:hypothetical protein
MALTEQGVAGTTLPGLTEQIVNLADEGLTGGMDSQGNVWLGNGDVIWFGDDKDYTIGTNGDQSSFVIQDYLLNETLLALHNDGTTTMHTAQSSSMGSWLGNFALAEDGAYIRY